MNNFTNILKKINVDEKIIEELKNSSFDKVKINQKQKEVTITIKTKENIRLECYKELDEKFKKYFSDSKVFLNIKVESILRNRVIEYYNYFIEEKSKDVSSLQLFLNRFNPDSFSIEVTNKIELKKIKSLIPELTSFLNNVGYSDEIDITENLSVQKKIRDEINKELESKIEINKKIKEKTIDTDKKYTSKKFFTRRKHVLEEGSILGKIITDKPGSIRSIVGEEDNIVVEAKVFDIDFFESPKSNFKIITLKLTDNTDSIYSKVFTNSEEDYARFSKELKEGKWYRIKGYTKNDPYLKEIVLNATDINEIGSKDEKLEDLEEIKRIELHAHTKMSQMDGLADEVELIKQAISFGHKAVAITDHNGVQAFPHVFNFVKNYNKNLKDNEEPFKAIYGTELTLIDDTVNIVLRPNKKVLLDETYVVFDFETTGFNAGGADSIIEIGAVKILNGEIIDKYDELINPGRKLPEKIIEITNITDEMLEDKDTEENAVKRFIDWVGDLPMVAHNAKFDVSFLEMAYKKYNLGTFTNPVIDTLELSRTMDNTYARHSLSALVKRYEIPWDEDAHHRADYDAEGTALVFHKMLKKLSDRNIETMDKLSSLASKDEIHKYGRSFHVNILAKNKTGLKNLFKLVSLANTTYLYKTPRILRSVIDEYREGLLIGSGCYESEVFVEAKAKSDEELSDIIRFYDYVEVQPIECYSHLIECQEFASENELKDHIRKIVKTTIDAGKIIVATGDVHHIKKEDRIYREIIVNQKVPGGGRHPLARRKIKEIPYQHFRTTKDMLDSFKYLGEDLAYQLVVENTNKIADMIEILEVIPDTGGTPFSPRVKSDDGKSYLDCQKVVTELVYNKASEWYGEVLPYFLEERIATELYGDIVLTVIRSNLDIEDEKEKEKIAFKKLHEVILKGADEVKKLVKDYLIKTSEEKMSEEELDKKLKKSLGGIIGAGFDPIYLIAQRLVKHSNDEGYLVGSRGSVGSSFVATLMGITEVNPLPAHYRCEKCKLSIFDDEEGNSLGATYSSGFDLPDKECPNCHIPLIKDGQDMPFATFLGFNADKVPDIDLNFSDLNQASAHAYTKVLFGEDNVYRAGTIGTVADKTAFGFVKGYCEEKEINDMRTAEVERLALGCTGVKRTTGQHPGGIVVIPDYKEVYDFTPYQYPADDATSEWRTTHFDYHSIEECVLKLDILGHSDPTQLRLIQMESGTDIMKVPLDDKETMSIFTSTKALGVTTDEIMCNTGTLGIPEFGTPFTIKLVEDTRPTTFAELVKISGLSHGTDVWVGNAKDLCTPDENGIIKVPFKETIGCRDDIMVYLMYHGVKPIKAFKIMEFVRRGKASKDPETWKEHVKVMKEANIPDWYIDSCRKIKYMFPKAHAAAYVISAFRIAWYKVHMPVYFYSSWLSSKATDVDVDAMIKGYDAIKSRLEDINIKGFEATNKENGQAESLKVSLEATARGIKFLNVDLYKSEATNWKVKSDTEIYPPFSAIEGLGITVANSIVKERKKREFMSIEDLQIRCKISNTILERMRAMGIFEGMDESSQMTLF